MRRRIGLALGTVAALAGTTAATPAAATAATPTATELNATALVVAPNGICSGVLIASRKVLTAGHCTQRLRRKTRLTILLGVRDPRRARGGFIRTRTWRGETSGQYDLTLIRLPPARPGENRTPVPAGTSRQDAPVGADAVMVGYSADRRRPRQQVIRRVSNCGRGINPAVLLCAGRFGDDDPPCAGDSGGPLFFGGKVVGILSGYFGGGRCGSVPFVYTRLSAQRARRLIGAS